MSGLPTPSAMRQPQLPLQDCLPEVLAESVRPQAKRGRKRCRGNPAEGDELFLPPHVRKERQRSSSHWANNWRPGAARPEVTMPKALPIEEGIEDLWTEHAYERRSIQKATKEAALTKVDEEEELLSSGDEPCAYELLDPEESEAKSDIWHEVNKDLLEYWALAAKLKEKKAKASEAAARQREEQESQRNSEEQLRDEAERQRRTWGARRRRTAQTMQQGQLEPKVAGQNTETSEELDASVLDFWQAHTTVNNGRLFEAARTEGMDFAITGTKDQASEARELLETALEEEEQQQKLARRARQLTEQVNDLFDI